MIPAIVAQVFETPSPIVTATPASVTESAIMARGLEVAQARAKRHGIDIGAEVIDLSTGSQAQRNAETPFPSIAAVKIPIAVLAARAMDAGTLRVDDLQRTDLASLGGAAAVSADVRSLGFGGIAIDESGNGTATPSALGAFLQSIATGPLLSRGSKNNVMASLRGDDAVQSLGAGFIDDGRRSFVVVALFRSADVDPGVRRDIVADVVRAARDAATQFPL